jgi:penicillin-binding protein 1B
VFKPFVYAAALQSKRGPFTAATVLNDDPTTFKFGSEEYTPGNWGGYHDGQFTLRHALASSNNIATVSLAEQVGFDNILKVALASGLNDRLRATPSLALGSYEVSPLEIAGAYTIFANRGMLVKPKFLAGAREKVAAPLPVRAVLSPAVAFIMQDLLAEVLRSGTGAGVHNRGFNVAAAGKTGTSRDGWFAGYVSNLICVVWWVTTTMRISRSKAPVPLCRSGRNS